MQGEKIVHYEAKEHVSLVVQDASGKDVDLSVYKGKVLLIVNVASQWYDLSLLLRIRSFLSELLAYVCDIFSFTCTSCLYQITIVLSTAKMARSISLLLSARR